jgi:septation ring formation regulator EzrA
VDNEQSSMVAKQGSSWGKSIGSLNNISSLPFMEIRFRSLGKALDELRTKRVQLDEDLRKGHIDQSDYASQLLNIIVETTSLNKERKEVEDKVKELRSNKLH